MNNLINHETKLFKGAHRYKTVCLFNCSYLFSIQRHAGKNINISKAQTLVITINIIKRTYLHQCYFELHKIEKKIAFSAKYANIETVSGPNAKSIEESCLSRFHLKKNVSGILEIQYIQKLQHKPFSNVCIIHINQLPSSLKRHKIINMCKIDNPRHIILP